MTRHSRIISCFPLVLSGSPMITTPTNWHKPMALVEPQGTDEMPLGRNLTLVRTLGRQSPIAPSPVSPSLHLRFRTGKTCCDSLQQLSWECPYSRVSTDGDPPRFAGTQSLTKTEEADSILVQLMGMGLDFSTGPWKRRPEGK